MKISMAVGVYNIIYYYSTHSIKMKHNIFVIIIHRLSERTSVTSNTRIDEQSGQQQYLIIICIIIINIIRLYNILVKIIYAHIVYRANCVCRPILKH